MRILDAGCGSGYNSLYLMQATDEPGSALFSMDISEKMLNLMEDKIDDGELYFKFSPGNNYYFQKEEVK